MSTSFSIAPSTDTGTLGVMHLKRFWQKSMARREGNDNKDWQDEWRIDTIMLDLLGIGLEQTITYLYTTAPSFPAFEQWIVDTNSGLAPAEKIQQFNALLSPKSQTQIKINANILSTEDLAYWDEHGYVIVRNAISADDCAATIDMIADYIKIDINDPGTWYSENDLRQGIMVQVFQHPQLDINRNSPRIRGAYEQLWKRKDIWPSTDRVGFNPPQTETWHFPGPHLHWDVSLKQPIPFGTQGILYLSDTVTNQGAFTLVPGFRHRVASWLDSLPEGANPRTQDLYALGTKPIAANAGDFIIWDHALPHGSSVNTSAVPRFVHYINYQPIDAEFHKEWI